MKSLEHSIIGCLILGGADSLRRYAAGLSADSFADKSCQTIFSRMTDYAGAGKDFDLHILTAELSGHDGISAGSLTAYLEGEYSTGKILDYVQQLRDIKFRTDTLNMIQRVRTDPVHEFVPVLQTLIWQYQRAINTDWTLKDAIVRTLDEIESRMSGIIDYPTGLQDIDNMMGGFYPGEITILAGRPSQGKSALAVNFCNHLLGLGKRVLYVDLETSDTKILDRMLSLRTQIPISDMLRGRIRAEKYEALVKEASTITSLPFWINDKSGTTVADVYAEVQKRNIQFMVLDYIQLMADGGEGSENTTERLGNRTRSFKTLAKEAHIPILLVSQLNRANEYQKDKEPSLASLRGSGELEQNADNVLMLYWEHIYDEEKNANDNTLLIKKQRHGPVGRINLYWRPDIMLFGNSVHREEEEIINDRRT